MSAEPPGSVRHALVASLVSRGITAVVALVAVPLVLSRLGHEGFGLVGFYGSLQALILLLDLGLSLTLSRELARLGAMGDAQAMRDTLRSLEVVYGAIALAVFAALSPFAPWLAEHWLRPGAMPAREVSGAILLMLAVVAARWPLTLYSGGLAGVQRQVALGWLTAAMAVVQHLGAVAALEVWGRTPGVYFAWQLGAGALNTLLAGALLWRALPGAGLPARFRWNVLSGVSAFALGTGGTSLLAVASQHLDKVILSRMLPLDQFGIYTLSATAAGALYRLIEPVYVVFYPRLSALFAGGGGPALARFYHRASQTMALLIVPAAAVLVAFAPEALWLWTRDPAVVTHGTLPLRLLAAGTALNGLVAMPYALQLAAGWPQLSLALNAITLVAGAPLTWTLARRFGAAGAASVWVAVNLFFLIAQVVIMHRRVLSGERGRWYRDAVVIPVAVATAMAAALRALAGGVVMNPAAALWVGFAGASILAVTGMAMPALREAARAWIASRRA